VWTAGWDAGVDLRGVERVRVAPGGDGKHLPHLRELVGDDDMALPSWGRQTPRIGCARTRADRKRSPSASRPSPASAADASGRREYLADAAEAVMFRGVRRGGLGDSERLLNSEYRRVVAACG
jgi:hypothetical protein